MFIYRCKNISMHFQGRRQEFASMGKLGVKGTMLGPGISFRDVLGDIISQTLKLVR